MSMSTTATTTTTANIGSSGNTTIGLLVGYGDSADPPRPPPRGRRRAQSVYNQPSNGNSNHRRSLADVRVSYLILGWAVLDLGLVVSYFPINK